MKTLKNYFLIALFGAVVLAGCRDDNDAQECPTQCDDPSNPECPNYDPCFGENPVTAEFRMFDEIFTAGPEANTWYEDDVIWDGRIKFQAVEKNAYYKWYLGDQVVEGYGDSVVIRNTVHLDPGFYPAALVVEKEPNTSCFPQDSGRDSTFRFFQVKNVCDLLIMNKFKGVYEHNPTDSLVIEFFPAKLGPGNQGYEYTCDEFLLMVAVNLRNDGDSIWASGPTGILNRYWKQRSGGSLAPVGDFEVFPDLTCRGEYRIINQDYVFTGKLIQ